MVWFVAFHRFNISLEMVRLHYVQCKNVRMYKCECICGWLCVVHQTISDAYYVYSFFSFFFSRNNARTEKTLNDEYAFRSVTRKIYYI